jgi:hypothetical protein
VVEVVDTLIHRHQTAVEVVVELVVATPAEELELLDKDLMEELEEKVAVLELLAAEAVLVKTESTALVILVVEVAMVEQLQ